MTTASERKFADRGIKVGSVFLMQPDVAIEFVEFCKQAEISVCGVEGFLRIGEGIQPQQSESCDYDPSSEDAHSLTTSFLRERLGSEFWFEVVTDEPPE